MSKEFKSYSMELAGRTLTAEIGRVCAQANGAVLMHYGDTVVLSTATASKQPREGIDFFPLSVEYNERQYAVGKIPGGFMKREGKPSENAILTDRVIDRPMRPLFPKDYRNDVTLENLVMSVDPDCSPELTAMLGTALAVTISDIPFDGPCAMTQVGLVDGKFVFNPTNAEKKNSELQLTVASTSEKVIMIEAGAKEVPEQVMIDARRIRSTSSSLSSLPRFARKSAKRSTAMRPLRFRRNFLRPSVRSFRRRRWKSLFSTTTSRAAMRRSTS